MTQFQKIATGLLGITHPEMFIPRPQTGQKPVRPQGIQVARTVRAFRLMFAALAMGSRTVALADNSELVRELGARARLLYGSDHE